MIRNILQLQNINDLTQDIDQKYLIEALANLGQRLGIKGDGLKYEKTTFASIINTVLPASDYIGIVKKTNTQYVFGCVKKSNIKNNDIDIFNKTNISVDDINTQYTLDFDIEFKRGYYKFILENSLLVSTDDTFEVYAGFVKESSNTNIGNDPVDILHIVYNNSNVITKTERIVHYNDSIYYITLNVDPNDTNNYTYVRKSITNDYRIDLSNVITVDAFKRYDGHLSDIFDELNSIDTPIQISAQVRYNTETDVVFSFVSDDQEGIDDAELLYISNDVTYTYGEVVSIYSYNKFVLDGVKSIYKHVLIQLYEYYLNEESITDLGKTRMLVPLDIDFTYFCNSNNPQQIYLGENIVIKTINISKMYDVEEYFNEDIIGFDNSDILYEKTSLHNFYIDYNDVYDNSISSIIVKCTYQLPYVNSTNTWVINGKDTLIKAVGNDAGNPNLIIIYSDIDSSDKLVGTVLNNINHKDEINFDINHEEKEFIVNPYSIIDPTDAIKYSNGIRCKTMVPKITDDNYEFLAGSLVLCVSSKQCINKTILPEDIVLNNNLLITSFWTLDLSEDNTENEFKYIVHPQFVSKHYALDLSSLSGMSNNIELYEEQNHNYLVLNSLSSNLLQENDKSIEDNSKYTIIQTKSAFQKYKDLYLQDDYLNELNFGIEILENIVKQPTDVIGIVSKKFISNPQAVTVTNSVYSRYPEYTFNMTVPIFDHSELINVNSNTLNRLNILSLDKDGHMYNSYIGTAFDDQDKTTLHIGTSNTNINIGTNGLIDRTNRDKFSKQNHLSIDFDNISLKGAVRYKSSSNVQVIDSIQYDSVSTTAIGKKDTNIESRYFLDSDQYNIYLRSLHHSSPINNLFRDVSLSNYIADIDRDIENRLKDYHNKLKNGTIVCEQIKFVPILATFTPNPQN